ncbi:hypothetical protein [Actinoplanes sp. NPDC049599]|uniref:hypothetical protein n=1 Tax=Actinoplanes sp. NPDC049599 TaxID=3363903 RepID=UPI003797AE0C
MDGPDPQVREVRRTGVAAAIPSARPRSAERRTTTAKSGPGDIAPRLTTPQNATSWAPVVMAPRYCQAS